MEKTLSTILRVKRRLDESPEEAIIVHCKRARRTSGDPIVDPSLFVFSGTVSGENQHNEQLTKILSKENSHKFSKSIDEFLKKVRVEHKQHSCESRYKIVNCNRNLKDEECTEYNLVDLERSQEENANADKFAYDLYFPQEKSFDSALLDNVVRINNLEEELMYGMYQDERKDSESEHEDSDDSNEENNWRNDYPDEEEGGSSIGEEDMRKAMENCDLGNELSSDGDEQNIYDDDSSDREVAVDQDDVAHYGLAYAKYKARILKERLVASKYDNELVHAIDDDRRSSDDEDGGFYYGQDEDSEHFRDQYKHDSDAASN